MGRFFDLLDDRRSLTRWHLGTPVDDRGEQIESWQFEEGRRLELGCVPCFPLQVRGEPLDYGWAALSIPVVSSRVVQLFERLHVRDVQFIPARVEGHAEPYFILNALRIIRCIDDARCAEVQYWKPEDNRPDKEGQYRAVYRMRIDPTQVGGAQIFRPWGWTVALIVSEELKQALEQAAITGTRFVEV